MENFEIREQSGLGGEDKSAHPDLDKLLFNPNIRIHGLINDGTVLDVLDAMRAVRKGQENLILEINTQGGDADAARRIALEIRLFRQHSGKYACCVAKTNVYSAGVTILAAFPKTCRFLTEDAVLLVHERRLQSTINLDGPIRSNLQIINEQLALLKTAEKLEMEGFREFVEGSKISPEDLFEKAKKNCYLTAAEALEWGLIEKILA